MNQNIKQGTKGIVHPPFELFLSIQLRPMGSNDVLDPTNFHCMDKNSFETVSKYLFYVSHKKESHKDLEGFE